MSPAAMAFSSWGPDSAPSLGTLFSPHLVIATIAALPRSAKLLWLSSPWRGRNSLDVHLRTSRQDVPIKNSTESGERNAWDRRNRNGIARNRAGSGTPLSSEGLHQSFQPNLVTKPFTIPGDSGDVCTVFGATSL